MWGRRLIDLWGLLNHCCEEKMESVNQFAKIGKLHSENTVIKLSIVTGLPTITAFVAAFDAKALNCTELLESYLAGRNINCHGQTNRNRHNWNIWHNTWSTVVHIILSSGEIKRLYLGVTIANTWIRPSSYTKDGIHRSTPAWPP